mmetsp:Transcript_13217/g.34651  ORF Transcript_13217/g.34651 Transcript_13217/m.34651 type:complete len:220 (-) Transcript_13217:44-703(-)
MAEEVVKVLFKLLEVLSKVLLHIFVLLHTVPVLLLRLVHLSCEVEQGLFRLLSLPLRDIELAAERAFLLLVDVPLHECLAELDYPEVALVDGVVTRQAKLKELGQSFIKAVANCCNFRSVLFQLRLERAPLLFLLLFECLQLCVELFHRFHLFIRHFLCWLVHPLRPLQLLIKQVLILCLLQRTSHHLIQCARHGLFIGGVTTCFLLSLLLFLPGSLLL